MERNAQKNGIVNLAAAVMVFVAAFAVTIFVNSLAGQAASVFLGLGALIAFAGWFQMRLEENERLEKLESHLAHLEHQYDQLNQVVLEQSRQLMKLQGQQQKISQTVESIELDRIKSTNAKPPHYQ